MKLYLFPPSTACSASWLGRIISPWIVRYNPLTSDAATNLLLSTSRSSKKNANARGQRLRAL